MRSEFSKNLVETRKLYGYTQQEAAELIGIKRATLGAYEEGRAEPSYELLQRICNAYRITNLMAFLFLPYMQEDHPPLSGSIVEEKYLMLKGKERVLADVLLGLKKE